MNARSTFFSALLLFLLSAFACAAPSFAQEKYPTRPIEFVVPWGPGGGSDQTARIVGKLLESELKIAVPIVNVPGGTGNTGMVKFLTSPADGYAICILAWDTLALLASQPPKWTMDDVVPLAIMIQLPSGLYVSGDRYPNWKSFEKEAKSNQVKIAISGLGSPDDITIGYFASKGLKIVPVPYAKPGERYAALMGGHVDGLYSPAGNIKGFVDGKQMRPVVFFHDSRLPEFADIPYAKEVGYDIALPQRRAILVKAGTDAARVAVLSNALARVAANPEYKEFLQKSTAAADSFVPTKESIKIMQSDVENMRKIFMATKK